MAHFSGSVKTFNTLNKFDLPMNPDGTFKIIQYNHKDYILTVSTFCIYISMPHHWPAPLLDQESVSEPP